MDSQTLALSEQTAKGIVWTGLQIVFTTKLTWPGKLPTIVISNMWGLKIVVLYCILFLYNTHLIAHRIYPPLLLHWITNNSLVMGGEDRVSTNHQDMYI